MHREPLILNISGNLKRSLSFSKEANILSEIIYMKVINFLALEFYLEELCTKWRAGKSLVFIKTDHYWAELNTFTNQLW